MGAADNAARIRRGYDAFNQGEVEVLVDLFAEDIVWHFPGTSKLGGDHVGRDQTLGVLGAYGAASGGTLQATPRGQDPEGPLDRRLRHARRKGHRGVALRR